jgi:hypothetical protein
MMTKRDGVAMTAGNRNTTSNSAFSGSRTPPSGAPDERSGLAWTQAEVMGKGEALLASDYVCTRRLDAVAAGSPVVVTCTDPTLDHRGSLPLLLAERLYPIESSSHFNVHYRALPHHTSNGSPGHAAVGNRGFRGCRFKPAPTALLLNECDCASAVSSRCNAAIQNSNYCLSIRCKLSPPVLFARYKANSVESLRILRSSAQQQQDIRYWQHTACHKGVQHQQLLKKHTADNIHPA